MARLGIKRSYVPVCVQLLAAGFYKKFIHPFLSASGRPTRLEGGETYSPTPFTSAKNGDLHLVA